MIIVQDNVYNICNQTRQPRRLVPKSTGTKNDIGHFRSRQQHDSVANRRARYRYKLLLLFCNHNDSRHLVFAEFTLVTNTETHRQTDHATASASITRA